MNKFDLTDKTAIITGGAQGFGLDIAKKFLRYVNKSSEITCVDPNQGMIKKGKEKRRKIA